MWMSAEPSHFRSALGDRIAKVADQYPTKTAAAEAAGVTLEQFNKWIGGEVKVPVDGLWRLARGAGIDFAWLCAGGAGGDDKVTPLPDSTGRMLRETPLRDVLDALATVMAEGVTFSPDRFADLVLDLHDYVIQERARQGAAAVDVAAVAGVIRLATRSPQPRWPR